MNPIVLIPARMTSLRLPDKPLADIAGRPMIVHVWERAKAAGIGPVYVAAAEAEIAEAVKQAGGEAVLTRPDHPSGSDRIFEALTKIDPERRFDVVVNVQGDLPTLDPKMVRRALEPLTDPEVDIATLAVEITREEERTNPNVVKAVAAFAPGGQACDRARLLLQSRDRAGQSRAALSPCRALRLSPGRAGALRDAAAGAVGAARAAGAAPRAGGRDADRRGAR